MVSNVDTTIQIGTITKFTTSSTSMSTRTDIRLGTYSLIANCPFYLNFFASTGGANTIDGAGILIRNMNASSNLVIMSGNLVLSKSK